MSDNRRNATLKALIDAAITELMIKTSGEQIYLDDNTTLSSKMAEMVTAINLRDKKTDVDAKIKTVTDSLTSTSESLSNDISTLRSEKADTSHTHDDRYYTKAETDTAIADAPKGDTGVWISQADYDALSDEDKALDLNYYIYDAKSNSGSDSSGISISQAEYDALSAEEKASEATYYIYDANSNPNAASIPFTSENYTATNVGAALEEVNGKLTNVQDAVTEVNGKLTNVQDAVTEVNGKLQVFKITLDKNTVLSPGNFALEFNTAKDGYSAMAIKSWALYNRDLAQYINVNGVAVSDTTASIVGRNSYSDNITIPSNAYIEILYAKR